MLLQPILGSLIARLYNRKIFGKQFSEVFGAETKPSSAMLDEFWALIEANAGSKIIHKLIRYLPDGMENRARWVEALRKSDLPLKFIIGMDDTVSGRPMIERLHDLMPDANVTCLNGIGHYPQIEAPEKTLATYFEFLDSAVSATR